VARRVLVHPDFYGDVVEQITWLAEQGETRWIERLQADLAKTIELLDRYPAAGALVERERSVVLRRVIFASTPYLAWYLYDEGKTMPDVMLVRVFHAHQRRPRTPPSRWLLDRRGER
jgi:plasmid stabilization system protein ParE